MANQHEQALIEQIDHASKRLDSAAKALERAPVEKVCSAHVDLNSHSKALGEAMNVLLSCQKAVLISHVDSTKTENRIARVAVAIAGLSLLVSVAIAVLSHLSGS